MKIVSRSQRLLVIVAWQLVQVVMAADLGHAQGEMAGEPTDHSIILETRLTAVDHMKEDRTVPGALRRSPLHSGSAERWSGYCAQALAESRGPK